MTTTKLRDLELVQVDSQRFVSLKLVTNQKASDEVSILDNELHLVLTESEAWRISEDIHEKLSKKYIPEVVYLDTVITKELFGIARATKELRNHFGTEGVSIIDVSIQDFIPCGVMVRFKKVNTVDYEKKMINIATVPLLSVTFSQLNQY